MVLSDEQVEELNYAIADYLFHRGFKNSLQEFLTEAGLSCQEEQPPSKNVGLLEKKWTSVVRLHRRVIELEHRLSQLEKEYFVTNRKREKLSSSEWIPSEPEKFSLVGHRSTVTRILFHPAYTHLISSSEDATIKIWDFETGEFEHTLKGHTDMVLDIDIDREGNTIASCSSDLSVRLWDFNSFECTRTLKGHEHSVCGVAFFLESTRLISCSRDKSLKVWDTSTGFCLRTLTGHNDWVRVVRFSGDGSFFASCSNDQTIRIWLAGSLDCKHELCGHSNVVESIEWLPETSYSYVDHKLTTNGCFIESRTSGPYVLSCSRDKLLKLWDAAIGVCVFTFTGHDNWIRAIGVHPEGKYIYSVSDDKSLRVWDLRHRRCTKSIQAHSHFCSCIAVHKSAQFVATSGNDKKIKIWECR